MILWIYRLPWGILFALMPMGLLLWTAAAYGMRKRGWGWLRWALAGVLAVWLIVVLRTTLLGRSPEVPGQLQPLFESYRLARTQREMYRTNFMNILMVFPGGLLLCALLPEKHPILSIFLSAAVLCMLTFGIEYCQLRFALGSPELDDVLHNTMGAIFGACAAVTGRKLQEKLP